MWGQNCDLVFVCHPGKLDGCSRRNASSLEEESLSYSFSLLAAGYVGQSLLGVVDC